MVFDMLRRKGRQIEHAAQAGAPQEKSSAAARVLPMGNGTQAAWGPRDTVSLTRVGFLGNPVGHRAVKLIAEAAAALPLVLQNADQRYDSHPLLTLLSRPNAAQARAELLEALYANLMLSGNAYLEAVAGEDGWPVELHLLRPDRMRVVPGGDGWPVAYDYSVGAKTHRFAMDPARPAICHLKSFHPLDDHYGLAPMQAAATAVEVHGAAARWSKSLLDNAAQPSGALVWSGSDGQGLMADDQFRRLSEEIEANFQGARNAGRPMVLEGGLDWKPMGFSPSDMEFHRTKDAAAREIAQAFGVPPMLLGIPGEATYANYQEANRAFYRLTILPLASRVAAKLSDWLMRFGDEVVELKPDLDQVQALAGERDSQWRRVAEADFLSEAEKRQMLGLPPCTQQEVGDD
ncbi:phage portal protein [Tritonibacter horizontis]|uniref:Phage portal protein n=1 Tax=Tritonibacter horizontis TaxID=1768241 RepID=A0A132BTN9_9RHOB|nr:phage portal protein [Tritonibacter horizontis]KUP91723.1 phage portal protein [Tritonibacter horizontis]